MLYRPNQPIPTSFPSEGALQQYCVSWFRFAYPQLSGALFAIKNNSQNAIQGAQDRAKGTLPGVSDLCLLLPGGLTMWIEMKLPNGAQGPVQTKWAATCAQLGHKYVICRSFEAFKDLIQQYYGESSRLNPGQ